LQTSYWENSCVYFYSCFSCIEGTGGFLQGYGTVAECVDSCTPFVYVSRPLFIEEHGLRLLLEQEGVGLELSRTAYEAGEWAGGVEAAWRRGRTGKQNKRMIEQAAKMPSERDIEVRQMAQKVGQWVNDWYDTMDTGRKLS
jgi:hypothetical protein